MIGKLAKKSGPQNSLGAFQVQEQTALFYVLGFDDVVQLGCPAGVQFDDLEDFSFLKFGVTATETFNIRFGDLGCKFTPKEKLNILRDKHHESNRARMQRAFCFTEHISPPDLAASSRTGRLLRRNHVEYN